MIDGRRGQRGRKKEAAGEGQERPPRRLARLALGARLHRIGVTANQITVLGLLLSCVTAVTVGRGYLWIGVILITVGGLMDALDGAVAKAAGTMSKRGAFFDSTADRLADGLIFGGVAWYFLAGHHPKYALLPFAILGMAAVVSYERAKAESLGFVAKGGLMERAERLIMLGGGMILQAFVSFALVAVLGVLLALTTFTAMQRFVRVWRQATAELPPPAVPPAVAIVGSWRTGRVESRWRAWREASLDPSSLASARRARPPASRWRARRQAEPLSSRVRRVLEADRLGQRAARSARSNRAARNSQAPAKAARRPAGRGLRSRFDQTR
jgi:CDP-diacylglycerol---glycerol-3-phosphate 3-phosphatidyltransferase